MAGPIPFTPIINGNDVTIQRLSDSGETGEETWGYNASINSNIYTISDNKVVWNDGTILQYNGVDVLPTDNIMDGAEYTTRAASTTGETWLLNETVTLQAQTFTIEFSSSGQNFNSFKCTTVNIYYDSTAVYDGKRIPGGGSHWINEAYRTVTFETAPTGDLLTWLQANGTKQSPKLSVDLTTLSGWANLSSGSHTIKIVAKGTGYRDSEKSAGVTVNKAASTVTLSAGTYKFVKTPNLDDVVLAGGGYIPFACKSYSLTANNVYGDLVDYSVIVVDDVAVGLYPSSENDRPSLLFDVDDSTWKYDAFGAGPYTATDDNKLRTIIVETDQTVSAEFYNWAITQGNLVKQAEGETWLLNDDPNDLTQSNQDFTSLNFTSNSQSFVRILRQYNNTPIPPVNSLLYYKSDGTYATAVYTNDDGIAFWNGQAYRTITFATAPTGDLLTWLQANGTKQS